MFEHWLQYPPVHITATIFAGVKSRPKANDEHALQHYLAQAPAGVPRRPRPGNV